MGKYRYRVQSTEQHNTTLSRCAYGVVHTCTYGVDPDSQTPSIHQTVSEIFDADMVIGHPPLLLTHSHSTVNFLKLPTTRRLAKWKGVRIWLFLPFLAVKPQECSRVLA